MLPGNRRDQKRAGYLDIFALVVAVLVVKRWKHTYQVSVQTFKYSSISPRLQIHLGILETPTPPRTPQLSEWGSVGIDHASFTKIH